MAFHPSICRCTPITDSLGHNHGRRPLMLPRSPFEWLKSTAQDLKIKDKWWYLTGRRGKNPRHHSSGDFRYYPTSYSLNFEEDNDNRPVGLELPLNNFMARLPATPDQR